MIGTPRNSGVYFNTENISIFLIKPNKGNVFTDILIFSGLLKTRSRAAK